LPSDEARSFERQHHLVNRRRADAKILLHIGFGRRPAVQPRVEVNKRQILALLRREGFCGATHAGHPIQLFVRASNEEEVRMNVRYRVELSQTERAELTALLSGGRHAARKLKRAQILLAAGAGASDDDIATSVGVGRARNPMCRRMKRTTAHSRRRSIFYAARLPMRRSRGTRKPAFRTRRLFASDPKRLFAGH
jgi:hypothetical protein